MNCIQLLDFVSKERKKGSQGVILYHKKGHHYVSRMVHLQRHVSFHLYHCIKDVICIMKMYQSFIKILMCIVTQCPAWSSQTHACYSSQATRFTLIFYSNQDTLKLYQCIRKVHYLASCISNESYNEDFLCIMYHFMYQQAISQQLYCLL